MAEEHWHLGVLTWLILVDLSHWIQLLVEVRVDDLVTKVVVRLASVPEVLWNLSCIKIEHICF